MGYPTYGVFFLFTVKQIVIFISRFVIRRPTFMIEKCILVYRYIDVIKINVN